MATVLIIGANRGIGLELARLASARGDEVIAACRKPSTALEALGVRIEAGVEVGSSESVAALSDRLGELELDVLLHNAGILRRTSFGTLDFDSIREQFEVNAMGPLRVVEGLIGHLREGSKVAIVTSRMGSIADNTSGGSYGYRMSKAAVNMAAVSLSHDLRGKGIAVGLLHPGWVKTDMTGGTGHIDAETSARGLLARVDALSLERSGGFWHQDGSELPW